MEVNKECATADQLRLLTLNQAVPAQADNRQLHRLPLGSVAHQCRCCVQQPQSRISYDRQVLRPCSTARQFGCLQAYCFEPAIHKGAYCG